jgi:uncharacterized protein (TIGR03083 family)
MAPISLDIDQGATLARLRAVAPRVSRLLHDVRDPSRNAHGVEWTLAETAAHMVGVIELYAGFIIGERDANVYLSAARDADTPDKRNAVANAMWLEEFRERDVSRLAPMLQERIERFIDVAAQADPHARFLTDAGVWMTAPIMTAAVLGELLIHGHDVARGAGLSWSISRSDALLVIAGVVAVLPNTSIHRQPRRHTCATSCASVEAPAIRCTSIPAPPR